MKKCILILILVLCLTTCTFSQIVYFCEEVTSSGYCTGENNIFSTSTGSGYIFCLVKSSYLIPVSNLTYKIYEVSTYSSEKYYDTQYFTMTDRYLYNFYAKLKFYKTGTFKVYVYDNNDNYVGSGKITIKYKYTYNYNNNYSNNYKYDYDDYGSSKKSFTLGVSFIPTTTKITSNLPSGAEGKYGYSVSLAYLTNSRNTSTFKVSYQSSGFELSGNNIKLNIIKGVFDWRTSTGKFRALFGLGGGLAFTDFVDINTYFDTVSYYSSYYYDKDAIVTGKTETDWLITLAVGLEFKPTKLVSVNFDIPFDMVFVSKDKFFITTSPMVGVNFWF